MNRPTTRFDDVATDESFLDAWCRHVGLDVRTRPIRVGGTLADFDAFHRAGRPNPPIAQYGDESTPDTIDPLGERTGAPLPRAADRTTTVAATATAVPGIVRGRRR